MCKLYRRRNNVNILLFLLYLLRSQDATSDFKSAASANFAIRAEDLALVGIKRRGIPLAERLGKLISGIEKRNVDTGILDIQFYRDDLSTAGVRPVVTPGAIGCEVDGRDIVICDDVLYTGRTIRAALDALFDHGRPRRVQLCVLIDRGHREIPIEATYVGKHVPTSSREIIEVKFQEVDATEQVLLVEKTS
jgi:pyrimidine operon attenuation protein / uracil phosphoribosyltransferase